MHKILIFLLISFVIPGGASAFNCPQVLPDAPQVSTPPADTPPFYSKYIDAQGIPILGSSQVCDRSLQVAHEIVLHMLSLRPDYHLRLKEKDVKVVVFAVNEKMTDLPEDRDLEGVWVDSAHTRKYDDLCGGGGVPGRPTTTCERNLIGFDDPYFGRMSVLIHEFGHTIQNLGLDQQAFNDVLNAYVEAQANHLFTRADGVSTSYMMSNSMEFFAEGTTTWFNAADPKNPANSPEELGRDFLKQYDPQYFQILRKMYPDDAWVYPRE